MSKPVDWTVGTSASDLITRGRQISGHFPVDGVPPREVLYRRDGANVTSYIVYDDNGRAIKRVDLRGDAHSGIPTPHVHEYRHHISPTGKVFPEAEKKVRPATLDEIP